MYTRRGDLESLMYNGLEWLGFKLPWKGQTLARVIKSKSEFKNVILAAKPKEQIYDFVKVPTCK